LPGDTLTVVITENSTVSASAQTQTNKAESTSGTLSHAGITRNLAVGIDTKGGGGGLIERTGKVVANLAVTVRAVDSRGNLLIHGEQDIEVNNERQRIALDGYVRAEDIGPDNTIPSFRVAGARIEFTGKGLLARQQSPGLINRILSFFWE
jgi:flagellar L-ring protein precursor FlgH